MRKPDFCIWENKGADQLRGNRKLISVFVFATQIVQSLSYLNPKFQASSHLLWLYSPVCVGLGRKPRKKNGFLTTRLISWSAVEFPYSQHLKKACNDIISIGVLSMHEVMHWSPLQKHVHAICSNISQL